MTTVAQMIEWMKTLPKDAQVECGVEVSKGYDTWMEMKPVNIEGCDIIAFTSKEDRIKYPNMAGKTIVMIQGE
jgi:uncharacterized protein YciU (UPF0263 family)